MRLTIPNRVYSFSQEKQNVITAVLDLYKHYLYNGDAVKYARFKDSTEGKYEEKNELFNKLFKKQAVADAYLPEVAVNDKRVFSNPVVRNACFALVSDMLDVIIPQTLLSGFNVIADVATVGMGDTKHFKVPNNNIFNVNKVARGLRKTEPQRLYNGDAVMIPEPRMITIEESFEEMLMGKVDWGMLISRIAVSFETEITTEIYSTIYATYSGLDTNLKEAGYSQQAFVKLAQRIEALNRSKVVVMGTKSGLASILPTNDHLKQHLGAEYNTYGYIRNFMGVDLMEIPQAITPKTTDFAIADDTLYFFSLGTDKPVKIAVENGGMMFENMDPNASADNSYFYSIRKAWDTQVITSSKYGMMKIS